jgi:hypothetical protein
LIQFDLTFHESVTFFIIVQNNNNNKVTLRTLEVNSCGQKDFFTTFSDLGKAKIIIV